MILDQTIKNLQKENQFLKAELERVKKEQQDTQKQVAGNFFTFDKVSSFLTAVVTYPDLVVEKISRFSENEGLTIQEIVNENTSRQFIDALNQVGASGREVKGQQLNLQFKNEDKSRFFDFTLQPVVDGEQKVEKIILTGYDVTQYIKNNNLLDQILHQFPIGVALHEGPEFRNTIINEGYYQFAYGKGDILNKKVAEVWPEIADQILPRLKHVYETGEPFHDTDAEFVVERGNGPEKAWFSFSYLPFRGDGENISGVLVWSVETSRYMLSKLEAEKIRNELQQQKAQLEATVNSIPDGYFVYDNQNNILHMNSFAQEILELTEEEKELPVAERLKLLKVETADGKPLVHEDSPLYRAQNGETLHGFIVKINRGNRAKWLTMSASPIISSDGYKYGVVVEISDISDVKYKEVKVRESEAQFRQLADAMPQLVWIARPDGYHEYFNRRWYEFTGTKEGETYGSVWASLLHPDDYQRSVDTWQNNLQNGKPYSIEYRIKRGSDNTYHWFLGRALPVFNDEGEIIRWFGTCTNIQELKATEQALIESQERYRLVNKATHDIIWDWDLSTNQLLWNEAVEQALGKSRKELLPDISSWHNYIHPDDRERVISSIQHAIDSKQESWSSEYRFGLPGGPYRTYFDRGFIACDKKGNPFRMIGSMLDLTERKETEKALKESQKLLQSVLEVMPVGVFVADYEGNVAITNTAAEKLWGGVKHIPINKLNEYKGWWRKTGKKLQSDEWAFARAFLKGESSQNEEIDIECFDGTRKTILNFAAPIYNGNGRIVSAVAAAMDITDRVKAEEALRSSEERFRTLADNISQLAWMADDKGWIFWYNKRWYDYTGTTPKEVQGWGWTKVHHPDHVDRVVKSIQHSWDTGERWEDLFPIRGKDGQYRWFLSRAIPVRNEQGKIIKWFGTNTDITEQRKSEIQVKKANELLESILYILAHDLKGPVANMHMATDLINASDNVSKKIMLLDTLKPQVERIEKTLKGVTNILQVQHTDESAITLIELESVIHDLLIEFKDELNPGELFWDFSRKSKLKYIEPLLQSILRNLVNNAIKYRRHEAALKIEISTVPKNSFTLLMVKDNGIGIDLQNYGNQLFKPFTRISSVKTEGTGIGLYIIKTIIEKNGGYIEVESTPGVGTTFFCYLNEYR